MGVHFRPLSPKRGNRKIECFSDPAFSTENRPRGPQSRHHGRSGARKAKKMEPKMMTFRGPAEKCEFEPLSHENLVFAVQRGPRIAPNFMFFSEGPSGGVFLTSGRPEMPSETDFGGFWADSGPPFGPIFGTFRHFLGGRNFDRKMIEIRGLIRRGRRHGRGLRKLILSLQTPNHAFVSEGHRKEVSSRFTPRRGAAN